MNVELLDVVLFTTYFLLLFLAIFWLLVLFSKKSQDALKKKLVHRPSFTTIVPAYNEEANIVGTLKSLIDLDYPNEKKEIIVVNDGSTDHTKAKVIAFIQQYPQHNIKLINQKNQGKGRAMNVGLQQATGEFFACLDADSFVHPDALKEMLPYFTANQNVAAVCPLLKVKKPTNILQKVQWCEYTINMFYKYLNARLDCIHVTPGPFSVYRTKIVRDLGGYDETTITEDLEIAIRLQKHQYKIVQTFDAIVETVSPANWKDLFRQRVRWYKGSVDNTITYKKLMFNKKYGDFGFMRMPTIILSGIIAIVLTATLLQNLAGKFFHWLASLQAINFDLITLIKNFSFNFNFLSLPFAKLFIGLTLIFISFFVMIKSYQVIKERITNHGRTFISLFTYLFIYGLFLTTVWTYIAFLFITKRRNTWGK